MFPLIDDMIGLHGTFYLFSAVMIVCTPVIYCIVPETKDLSLEMVENYFLPKRTRFYIDLARYCYKMTTIYTTFSHTKQLIFLKYYVN